MMAESAKLSLEDVAVTYRTSRGPLDALGPMRLDVDDGEFVAVLGPSGCGKSTLLKIISGLLAPSRGRVVLGGVAVTRPQQKVGIVFQQPTLLPWKSVIENVLEPLRIAGTYSAAAAQKAEQLLAMVGLEGFANHYPHEL